MGNTQRQLLIVLITLLVTPISAVRSQDLPELLLPVDQKSVEKLLRKSNYGLRSQLYFTKRYRIVQIHFNVLEKNGTEFTITPFDDLIMRATTKQTAGPSSFEQLREWTGELLSPGISGATFDSTGTSVKPPRPLINLWVRSGDHEVSLRLVKEIAAERRANNTFGGLPDISDAPTAAESGRIFTKLNLRTLSGQWFVPARAAQIVIRPVEDDPRYHLIYEEDPSKLPQSADTPSEDTTRKLQRREQFMKQLEQERAAELRVRER